MPRSTRWLAGLTVAGGLVTLAIVVRLAPAVGLSLALAAPSTDRALGWLASDPAREGVSVPSAGRPLTADLYRPTTPRGALLLVHGLSPAGRRQPDLVRLARLLARHGQLVLVPDFETLRSFRLSGREVAEIGDAVRYLRGREPRAGVAGFSFGAGPALLAAREQPGLRLVASFGGYADLRHVIAFVTTGVHEFGGRRYAMVQEEYNRWKLLALLAGLLAGGDDAARLRDLADRRLADPGAPMAAQETGLGAEGQSLLALVLNRQPAAVDGLLALLPARVHQALDALSPLGAVAEAPGRLLIAHGAADRSIPFTESLRLAEAAGGRTRAVVFRTFHHTGPESLWGTLADRLRDGWRLVTLTDLLLS
jgi:dienelactone hydrolase